jgi:hypothetical protein
MKPGDHPEFFRLPPPPGRSRESTIVLDRLGRFFHDGDPVEHKGLHHGFATWIARHPDDGRFILENGYDWCYFTVEDTPYFIRSVRLQQNDLVVELFDGTEESLALDTLHVGDDEVLRARVKGDQFDARFTREAQLMIAPFLAENPLAVVVGNRRVPITGPASR